MGHLHELLAVEKTKQQAVNLLMKETAEKFSKDHYWSGHDKSLKMIEESLTNKAIEDAAHEAKSLPTTVYDTVDYLLNFWVEWKDVVFQKNKSNQVAVADIVFKEKVIASNVPVDELLGLEVNLENMRKLFSIAPTLNAAKAWEEAPEIGNHVWKSITPDVTSKTEKVMTPVIMVQATDKHPAQVEKVTKDVVIGTFTTKSWSGALTSAQKANVIATLDELMSEVKKARMRANSVEASKERIGDVFKRIIMDAIK